MTWRPHHCQTGNKTLLYSALQMKRSINRQEMIGVEESQVRFGGEFQSVVTTTNKALSPQVLSLVLHVSFRS